MRAERKCSLGGRNSRIELICLSRRRMLLGSYVHGGRAGGVRVKFVDWSKSLVKGLTIERKCAKGVKGPSDQKRRRMLHVAGCTW